ncbi:MAG TPA: type II secretion system F family protein [Caulobacteraceae bacterium]|jgi:tight adherence protein B|nr:type II secretion system F family protein [Caulobacteraceae bacterium]
MTAASLLTLLVMVGALCVGSFLWLGSAGERRLHKRVRRLATPDMRSRLRTAGPQLRRDRPNPLEAVITRLLPNPEKVRQRLISTGLEVSISNYLLASLGVFGVAVVLGLLAGFAPLLALLLGAAAGLLAPHLAIGFLISRRKKAFSKTFPDAIGLMVRGLKAGLPATEGVNVVGRETQGPVAEEFRRASDQVRLGQPLEDALWTAAKRVNIAEFDFLVITLGIQRETGGNLAETLENLDDMLRKRQQMKLKVKAMASEATATAMIIGCLPFVMSLMLFLVARAYISTLFITPLGHILLGVGAFWLSLGAFIMAQMVRFEI